MLGSNLEYLSWLCAMMHVMHHSVLLAQWSAEVRHTLTASGYPPRLLQLKKLNRGLVWGELQASIIEGVCCWLWQDSNVVMGKFLFFFFEKRPFKPFFDPFWSIFTLF